MILDFEPLKPAQIYHAMTQVLIPRPIAWVLSENEDNSHNLAPFSYFSGVCSQPPLISLSIGHKKDGQPKDTRRNILERKKFIIHIPSLEQAQEVTDSAKDLDYQSSELDLLNLETLTPPGFSLPILKDSKIALECEYFEMFELGEVKQALIIGRIKKLYASDNCIIQENDRTEFSAKTINPLSRLGGKDYAGLNSNFSIQPS